MSKPASMDALIGTAVINGTNKWQGKRKHTLRLINTKRTVPRTHHKPESRDRAPYAYTCVGCHQEFFDGIRKSQSCCGAEECQVVRRRMSSKESIARRAAGTYAYTCLGCKQEFFDALRKHQEWCRSDECIKARHEKLMQDRLESRRLVREGHDVKVRDEVADQIARIWETKRERSLPDGVVVWESLADIEEAYYTVGLTPMQVKARAIKNAARLAELRMELKRFGGKS